MDNLFRGTVLLLAPGSLARLAPVPDIEVNVVPVTGAAEGTIIADASVPYLGLGILDEPIVCSVREGYIVEMTGGAQADFLREHLESFGDRNCFNVAELGVGLNPNARLTGEMARGRGRHGHHPHRHRHQPHPRRRDRGTHPL